MGRNYKTFDDFMDLYTAVNGCKDPKFSCRECPFSKYPGHVDCSREKEIGLNAALELLLLYLEKEVSTYHG